MRIVPADAPHLFINAFVVLGWLREESLVPNLCIFTEFDKKVKKR